MNTFVDSVLHAFANNMYEGLVPDQLVRLLATSERGRESLQRVYEYSYKVQMARILGYGKDWICPT